MHATRVINRERGWLSRRLFDFVRFSSPNRSAGHFDYRDFCNYCNPVVHTCEVRSSFRDHTLIRFYRDDLIFSTHTLFSVFYTNRVRINERM